MKNKKILIIQAHLDDEVFGMGGTLLKLSKPEKNNEIKIVSFCNGLYKKDSDRIFNFELVCKTVNASFNILSYTDVTLYDQKILELSKKIDKIILEFKPDIIFTHSKNDIHPDHRMVSEIVDISTRRGNIKEVYKFSVPGNTEWLHDTTNIGKIFFDTSKYFNEKKILIQLYKQYEYPDPLNIDKIESRDEYIGSLINTEKAESFEVHRIIK